MYGNGHGGPQRAVEFQPVVGRQSAHRRGRTDSQSQRIPHTLRSAAAGADPVRVRIRQQRDLHAEGHEAGGQDHPDKTPDTGVPRERHASVEHILLFLRHDEFTIRDGRDHTRIHPRQQGQAAGQGIHVSRRDNFRPRMAKGDQVARGRRAAARLHRPRRRLSGPVHSARRREASGPARADRRRVRQVAHPDEVLRVCRRHGSHNRRVLHRTEHGVGRQKTRRAARDPVRRRARDRGRDSRQVRIGLAAPPGIVHAVGRNTQDRGRNGPDRQNRARYVHGLSRRHNERLGPDRRGRTRAAR